PHPVWEDVPDDSYFYFVHSYAVRPTDASVILATTDYDGVFPSAIGRANVFGTQFHPEKSGRHGLRIYRNFLRWAAPERRRDRGGARSRRGSGGRGHRPRYGPGVGRAALPAARRANRGRH